MSSAKTILQNAIRKYKQIDGKGSNFGEDEIGSAWLITSQGLYIADAFSKNSDKDTLDETLVQILGDTIQNVFLFTHVGRVTKIAASLLGVTTDITLGNLLKQALKSAKNFMAYNNGNFDWGYVDSSWFDSSRGYQPLKVGEYAKIRTYKGEPYIPNGGFIEYQIVSSDEYYACREYVYDKDRLIDEIQRLLREPQAQIEVKYGAIHVTMPDGTVYAQPYDNDPMIRAIGGDKNDFLYGSDSSMDQLEGGSGSDYMAGGKGYDIYIAGDGDIIEDSGHDGEVKFNGTTLTGGTYNEDKGYYESEDKSIEYHLNGSTLIVKQGNESLTINNYDKQKQSLNINLAEQKGKEIAIVIDTTGSMQDDIDTAKQTARIIAQNIFRTNSDQTQYSKISIVTFSDNSIKTIGTYTTIEAFQAGINGIFIENGSKEYAMAAMLEGMSNFTADNGLSKEIYLMTDEPGDDNHRKAEVLAMARNLKMPMTRMLKNSNDNEVYDNSVKINIISINSNLNHFKELSDATGGNFFQPNSLSELEDALFELSNLGTNKPETIIGNDKDNTIDGKGGDDTLVGNLGSDTYLFDDNFGKDTIIETNKDNKDTNIIKFTNDTKLSDLTFTQNANDLIINHKNKQDSITIKDFYADETKISYLEFSDGSRLSNINLKDLAYLQSNKSILYYANENEANLNENLKSTFFMADNNTPSNISGAMLNDAIIGSNQKDNIWGGYGDDILIGRKGDDTLNGGKGNDKYIYSKFDGSDIIQDNGGNDTLVLKGISKDETNFTKQGNDLIISFNFNNDKITITNHFKWLFGKPNKIENIIFDKDESLEISRIDSFISNSKFSDEFETKIFTNETPNLNKIANDLAFRFANETMINLNEFANFTNSKNSEFITSHQIDKIIEQVSAYNGDNGYGNFTFDDMKDSMNLQVYGA